jgi:hypothetical protein
VADLVRKMTVLAYITKKQGKNGKPDLDPHNNSVTDPKKYETVEQHSSVTVWTGSEL